MEVRAVLCAQSVSIDQRRNSLSVFHIIEEWNFPAFPAVVTHVSVVTLFVREPNEPIQPERVFLVIRFANREIFRGPLNVNFQGHLRLRFVSEIQGLIVDAPGTLHFVVVHNDRELGEWVIPVNDVGQPIVQAELPLAT